MLKKGDIVRRRAGWTPMEVIAVNDYGSYVDTRYCGSREDNLPQDTELASNFILIRDLQEIAKCPGWPERLNATQTATLEKQTTPKGHKTMSKDLYQTREDTPRFGTKLTTNSAGKVVLEMKGMNGAVELFDADQLELVMPYTVDVRFIGEGSNGKRYAFFGTAGSVAVGDLLILDSYNSMVEVIEIDTKSRLATATLKGRKLATTAI